MTDPFELRLSGAGGQGLITAGVILADAALLDGKQVVQTQMYGPSARLGASRAEVIIAQHEIAYPEVRDLSLLLCMSSTAFDRYAPQTAEDTYIVVDSTAVDVDSLENDHFSRMQTAPITGLAKEVGNKIVANVVALGAINVGAQIVSWESLQTAVLRHVPDRFRTLNTKALMAGKKDIDLELDFGATRAASEW